MAVPLPRGRLFLGVRPAGHLHGLGVEVFNLYSLHAVVGVMAWPPREGAAGIRIALQSGATVSPVVAVPFWTSGLSVGVVLH